MTQDAIVLVSLDSIDIHMDHLVNQYALQMLFGPLYRCANPDFIFRFAVFAIFGAVRA